MICDVRHRSENVRVDSPLVVMVALVSTVIELVQNVRPCVAADLKEEHDM